MWLAIGTVILIFLISLFLEIQIRPRPGAKDLIIDIVSWLNFSIHQFAHWLGSSIIPSAYWLGSILAQIMHWLGQSTIQIAYWLRSVISQIMHWLGQSIIQIAYWLGSLISNAIYWLHQSIYGSASWLYPITELISFLTSLILVIYITYKYKHLIGPCLEAILIALVGKAIAVKLESYLIIILGFIKAHFTISTFTFMSFASISWIEVTKPKIVISGNEVSNYILLGISVIYNLIIITLVKQFVKFAKTSNEIIFHTESDEHLPDDDLEPGNPRPFGSTDEVGLKVQLAAPLPDPIDLTDDDLELGIPKPFGSTDEVGLKVQLADHLPDPIDLTDDDLEIGIPKPFESSDEVDLKVQLADALSDPIDPTDDDLEFGISNSRHKSRYKEEGTNSIVEDDARRI